MTSPTPMNAAAALMTGCLRASCTGDQHLPGRPPRPGVMFSSAISAPWGTYSRRGPGRSAARGASAVPGPLRHSASQIRIVGEVESPPGRLLHRDHEAHPIGAATGEWRVGVFDGDRIHVAAALIGTYAHYSALDRGYLVGIGHVGNRQSDPGIAAHVFRLPDRIGGAHEDVFVFEPYPHHPVAR